MCVYDEMYIAYIYYIFYRMGWLFSFHYYVCYILQLEEHRHLATL